MRERSSTNPAVQSAATEGVCTNKQADNKAKDTGIFKGMDPDHITQTKVGTIKKSNTVESGQHYIKSTTQHYFAEHSSTTLRSKTEPKLSSWENYPRWKIGALSV